MSTGEFTVPEGLAWLGLTSEHFTTAGRNGRFGNPVVSALMDVRYAEQRGATTPEAVLAKHDIDLADFAASL